MNNNNISFLRETLQQLSTEHLDAILQEKLKQDSIDGEAVRLILSVLAERESDYPVEIDEAIESAWGKYRTSQADRSPKPVRKPSWLIKVVSAAAIICLLILVIPQEVEAETFFERLIRWTDSVFELFAPGDRENVPSEYVFETDHPGLQQVYDAVTELGVTVPVVPMWLPEGYDLMVLEVDHTPVKTNVTAEFISDFGSFVYVVDVYAQNTSYEYYKDETPVEILERGGVDHSIIRNRNAWMVIWTQGNIECSIAIDCQEDVLNTILSSIYSMEGNT